jgi:hypothetical protein
MWTIKWQIGEFTMRARIIVYNERGVPISFGQFINREKEL